VYNKIGDKKNGFYVDLGAGHQTQGSNTAFFDIILGWKGLCIDAVLSSDFNKRSCLFEHTMVTRTNGEECNFILAGGLGGIEEYVRINMHKDHPAVQKGKVVKFKGKTILEIFSKHQVPKDIDYFSIDIEGAEHEILLGMEEQNIFEKYNINIFSIEHNWNGEKRNLIRDILERNNFNYAGSYLGDDFYEKKI
ncbi:unnamed protein product, partial [marine sediment metagenome]